MTLSQDDFDDYQSIVFDLFFLPAHGSDLDIAALFLQFSFCFFDSAFLFFIIPLFVPFVSAFSQVVALDYDIGGDHG